MSSFNFDLKTTAINVAVKWEGFFLFRFASRLKKLFLVLFAILFVVFAYNFLKATLEPSTLSLILGLSIISLTLTLAFWQVEAFLNSRLKWPKIKTKLSEVISDPGKYNLAGFLDFNSARAVARSIKFSERRNLGEVSSTVLLYNLLSGNKNLNFVFSRILLDLKEVRKLLKTYLSKLKPRPKRTVDPHSQQAYSKDFQAALQDAFKIAQKKKHQRVREGDLITALAKHDLIFKKILIDSKLKVADIENLTWWLETLAEKIAERKKFWKWKNLLKKGSLAKTWASGYTITLDRFGIDFSEALKKRGFQEVIGHQKEIKMVERILSRRDINNCLLVGIRGRQKEYSFSFGPEKFTRPEFT